MYKQVINNKINIKDFFDVYPPLVKVFSEESNKYSKLFEEPKKRGVKAKKTKQDKKLNYSYHSTKSLYSAKESLNDSFKSSENSKNENTVDEVLNKSPKKQEQQDEKNNGKRYFLINKGLELQRKKMKRTHSIKKSLTSFLYKTSVIGKLSDNLYYIENRLNGGNNFINKKNKNLEEKIEIKIHNIVEKLSNQLTIEKVPENKFVIKMNDVGDKCYFLLSGKLSIMKPVEYKNIQLTSNEYIHYLVNLMKYNEIDLINKVIDINHIHINFESLHKFKIITKGIFLRKIDNYLETFKTVTKEDFETLLDEYNLKFEDFNLDTKATLKDIEDINNNTYHENNTSFDSDSEKSVTETKSKYAIFKVYLNKFNLSVEEKVIMVNFNFLFNPHEEKKTYNFTLYKYEYFLYLFPGSFFGDMALESKVKRRNASIRTEEECFILSLDNDDYISLLYEDNKKLKSMDLIFLTNKFFFNEISPVLFEKYYFAKFKYIEKFKDDVIYQQDNEFSSVFFLKKGEYKLEMKTSVIDIHNIIKFFIDMLEEKNYLNYSTKKIDELKETYLSDPELLDLKSKNYLYKEKFNEKYKLEISTINQHEILGDLELFLTSGYINTCTIISQKAEYFEIKKRDLSDIFIEEKEILPIYYQFVMNKLISQIKRLYYLKNNLINQIKSKIKSNYYQPLVSQNFYNQIKNDKTNTYFSKKRSLKRIMPVVFKFSHFTPPVIYDSKWKPKKFEFEKNDVYNYYMRELEKKEKENKNYSFNKENKMNTSFENKIAENKIIENKGIENRNIKKNVFRNQHISKILEEVSTSKSFNNTLINNNSENKNKTSMRNRSILDLYNFPQNIKNGNTIVAGKYYLSLKKIKQEMSNVENHDPLHLNIVKKLRIEKFVGASTSTNNSNYNTYLYSSNSNNSVLPLIQLYKQRNFLNPFKKKENLSEIYNSMKKNIFEMKGRYEKKNILNKDEIKRIEKMEISQAVKNFYNKRKKSGYSSIVNKNNNRYYKVGRNSFCK